VESAHATARVLDGSVAAICPVPAPDDLLFDARVPTVYRSSGQVQPEQRQAVVREGTLKYVV
jgi:hypothetical protein